MGGWKHRMNAVSVALVGGFWNAVLGAGLGHLGKRAIDTYWQALPWNEVDGALFLALATASMAALGIFFLSLFALLGERLEGASLEEAKGRVRRTLVFSRWGLPLGVLIALVWTEGVGILFWAGGVSLLLVGSILALILLFARLPKRSSPSN